MDDHYSKKKRISLEVKKQKGKKAKKKKDVKKNYDKIEKSHYLLIMA